MPLPKAVQKQTAVLTKNFDKCMKKLERLYATGRYDEYLALREGELATIYKDACGLVREADAKNAPYRADPPDIVQPIIDEVIAEDGAVDVGCLTLRVQDYRQEPIVIKDRRIIQNPITRAPGNDEEDEDPKPHPRSNPYALFSFNPPNLTATPTDRAAIPIYDACCEISSVRDRRDRHFERCETDRVVDMQLSSGGSCLAVLGWVETKVNSRNRRTSKFTAPWISYHFPDEPNSKFTRLMQWGSRSEVGLAGVPSHMTLDESQRLIFVANNDRIKSFEWATANGALRKRPTATHTLHSKGFNGPMATLSNGTLIRAGTGIAAIWNLSQLKTHGPKGDRVIGKEIFIDDECEYDSDCDHIPTLEYSSGSVHTSKIAFVDDRKLNPKMWQVLPHSPSTVLVAGRMERNCSPAYVSDVSISTTDPRVFLSSCRDGCARLFDVRRAKPVLQLAAGKRDGAVALAHPDGIPTVFTAFQSEDFKVWDLRSRVCVYELGTLEYQDSSVSSAWDSGRNSLYSLRSCFIDGEYSDDSDADESVHCSRICRYSFKDKPRYAMLPADDPKVDEEGYYEPEYDTEVPMDDSDEDYVD
ncbi:hypothetical protein RSOLAG22IIIB_10139 [Rhizoctonia solani]|uniref:Uncharacterized protein n=1 Tax=Rhizoctonia solani TaxID=456999 RepID=A0A0K6G2J1_9AGAM|nr:hypothetical protein RSOLAG22IIIB_10139 [Rhizoctonia solani]